VTRYVRYQSGGAVSYGEIRGTTIQPLEGEFAKFSPSAGIALRLEDVKLLAPSVPSKILSIGPNFTRLPGLNEPIIWTHPVSSANDPDGIIELPPGHPSINHESELAIVIGRRTKAVNVEQAADCIFGYTCYNDVTAGDFSVPGAFKASHYYVDGKIFDGFAPFGPWFVTDLDTRDLQIECRVNGEVRQRASTADFVFSPYQIVSTVSNVMTLLPGDVIATGSPPGMKPLRHGDIVEVEIENIGILRNHVRSRV